MSKNEFERLTYWAEKNADNIAEIKTEILNEADVEMLILIYRNLSALGPVWDFSVEKGNSIQGYIAQRGDGGGLQNGDEGLEFSILASRGGYSICVYNVRIYDSGKREMGSAEFFVPYDEMRDFLVRDKASKNFRQLIIFLESAVQNAVFDSTNLPLVSEIFNFRLCKQSLNVPLHTFFETAGYSPQEEGGVVVYTKNFGDDASISLVAENDPRFCTVKLRKIVGDKASHFQVRFLREEADGMFYVLTNLICDNENDLKRDFLPAPRV